MKVLTRILWLLFFCYACLPVVSGQALSFDLKKPKKFENRKLGSEKFADKKFTLWRKFTQNAYTKFNWHFNAYQKLAGIMERAKAAHKDDYSQLLTFYNYSLDQTSTDRELDSVIYKSNAGILVHDLRNSWIDNLYLLMGKAYYFKKEFDTAYLTFQYINYAFSPKEKDGYDKPIGSNANAEEGGNAFSISTKENTEFFKKMWSRPPSRNETFLWQIKTFIAKDELPEAAGLIETLKNDPQFPERLKSDLHEVQALWFYKQQRYDSAAVYLELALDNAENRNERARWEYLIAQLYERVGKHDKALEFYDRTVSHTFDPVLEVYARLNSIRQNKGDEKAIQENIDALLKMARRDKYLNYRDIIYYMAAQMELERNNPEAAKALLLKATQYTRPEGDMSQKNKAFLLLAELSFKEKKYSEAKHFYDSVSAPLPPGYNQEELDATRGILAKIAEQEQIIYRQDSLQHIAAMPEPEREALLKKMSKQLRKKFGIKEEEDAGGGLGGSFNQNNDKEINLFSANEGKGEWYFNNPGLKGKGFTEFKSRWGNRKNVDNWRRASAMSQAIQAAQNRQQQILQNQPGAAGAGSNEEPGSQYSYESLLKNIPLTADQMARSNDSIEAAQVLLGKTLMEGLEDYPAAITTLEGFLDRFPYSNRRPEALFHLYYCYYKTGATAKAQQVAQELKQKFAGTDYEKIVSNPKGGAEDSAKSDMTKRYENIYNLFIEGSFPEALAQKKTADSLYGANYWTPQLLYIQSIYHIRERQDDSAKVQLQHIINLYGASPMAAKAQTMIDVLNRRKEIEDYLTKLQIERPAEDSTDLIADAYKPVSAIPQAVTAPKIGADSAKAGNLELPPVVEKEVEEVERPAIPGSQPVKSGQPDKKDTVQVKVPTVVQGKQVEMIKQKPVKPVADPKSPFALDLDAPHMVALVLDKVDRVYVTEARNAYARFNKEKYYNKPIEITNDVLDENIKLLLMSSFENANAAISYMENARKVAATEVIPWMPAGKYSFIIITGANLEVLKNSKDITAYRQFLAQYFPGKF